MDRHYRQLSRYAAVLAFLADISLLVLGGALKRKELLSARLGDMLSELYLLSAVLKRFEDEGRPPADEVLVDYCMATGLKALQTAIDEIFANFPSRLAAWFMCAIVRPDAGRRIGPSDDSTRYCAEVVTAPSEARERLTGGLYIDAERGGAILVERAFRLVDASESIRHRLRQAKIRDWHAAAANGSLTQVEIDALQAAQDAVHKAIMVDDFAPAELAPGRDGKEAQSSQSANNVPQAVRSI